METKKLYYITEIGKKHYEKYALIMTAKEVREYCKNKRAIYGYDASCNSGDRSYDCFAVEWTR